ncbi:hypothetical protein RP20_CCG020376 [Aedes albopictus]|nr:hypothetical protein RP20_CCG020376 [Aedes albopictus]
MLVLTVADESLRRCILSGCTTPVAKMAASEVGGNDIRDGSSPIHRQLLLESHEQWRFWLVSSAL